MKHLGTRNGFRCFSLQTCVTVVLALLMPGLALGQTFVQIVNNAPNSGTNVVFANPESAGDLNVVVIGWGDQTSSVASVTDSNSNNYVLAGTSGGEGDSQAIYYAKNISVSTSTTPTVTVTFSPNPLTSADVRVLEYHFTGGTSAVTVDNWMGNSGGSTPATSNPVTTSTSSLIVGAGTASDQFTAGGTPTGLTSRGINAFGDVTMDSNGAVAAGSYHAGANVVGGWVMQVVGFSVSGITGLPVPTVASISPTSGSTAGGTAVAITGTNFANGALALFGTAPTGLSLVNCVVANSTTLNCNTPGDNEGPKDLTVVNVDGQHASLTTAFTYTLTNPTITGISPASSTTNGDAGITITGTNFETGAHVYVGGLLPRAGTGLFADNIKVTPPNTITINSPAFPVGTEDVTVVNPDGGSMDDSGALTYALGTGPINYIQRGDAATTSNAQNVPVPMTNPQGKGNLNVVIIGWSDTTAQVSSVSDTEGNTYVAALAAVNGSSLSQVIYYAKNIKGDGATPNTLTIHFNRTASTPDIRVLEYSGLDPNSPLDQGVSNAGAGSLADSGLCTTTSAVELIVAAATVGTNVTGSGPLFTTVDYTANGDNAEHQITSSIGSCEAQVPVAGSNWVIQSVSFKAPAGTTSPNFTLTADPPTNATVSPGGSASYALTLAAQNGFNSAVALACSGLPAGATCSFSPTSPVTPGTSTPVTLTIATSATTPVGAAMVTITGTSGALNHTAQVTLTVGSGSPNFTISAGPTSATIASPGGSATSTITITATGGFSSAVSLVCSVSGTGTPAPTCSLNPPSISPGTTSTLTVSTTANSSARSLRSTGMFYALLLPIGGILGVGFTSRRKKLLGILMICLAILGVVIITSCGGGGSSSSGGGGTGGTPAGAYTVTVTGTSGSLAAQTATFTATVQ